MFVFSVNNRKWCTTPQAPPVPVVYCNKVKALYSGPRARLSGSDHRRRRKWDVWMLKSLPPPVPLLLSVQEPQRNHPHVSDTVSHQNPSCVLYELHSLKVPVWILWDAVHGIWICSSSSSSGSLTVRSGSSGQNRDEDDDVLIFPNKPGFCWRLSLRENNKEIVKREKKHVIWNLLRGSAGICSWFPGRVPVVLLGGKGRPRKYIWWIFGYQFILNPYLDF